MAPKESITRDGVARRDKRKQILGNFFSSDNIPPAPWANQYYINTTHDWFIVAITVPIVTAKRIARSKHV